MESIKKPIFGFVFLLFLVLMFYSGIITFFNYDPVFLYINNSGKFMWPFIILSSIFVVIPLLISSKKINMYLGLLFALLLVYNQLLIASSFIYTSTLNLLFNTANSNYLLIGLLITFSMIVIVVVSKINTKTADNQFIKIYYASLVIFILHFFVTYFRAYFDIRFLPLSTLGYGFFYQITTLYRGLLLYILVILIVYKKLNKCVLKNEKWLSSNMISGRSSLLVIWALFGFIGLERVFISKKKYYIFIQFITLTIIGVYIFITLGFNFHPKYNLLFVIVFWSSIFIKLLYWIFSFKDIMNENINNEIRLSN